MKLTKFTVKNFRSIKQATLPLSSLTVLIGPNNEGKSNILHALVTSLEILSYIGPVARSRTARYQGRDIYDWSRDFPVDLQQKKPGWGSVFTLVFELTSDERADFQTEIKSGLVDKLPIEISAGADEITFKVPLKGPGGPAKTKKPDAIARFIGRRLDYQYIPAIRPAEKAQEIVEEMVAREIGILEEQEAYQAAMSKIAELQQPILDQLSERITRTLQVFLSDVRDVRVSISSKRRHLAFRRSCEVILDDGTPTPLEQKGDGAQSLAAISLMRHTSERMAKGRHLLLAIEEPESHLHPSAIHQLRQVLQEISTTRQVIITSHCPLFVERNKISRNIIVAKGKASPARKVEDVRDILGVRAADNLRHAELVLVVEGECDKIAMQALLKSASKELARAINQRSFAVDSLAGATNLSYKLCSLRDAICSAHVFLDNDHSARDAAKRAENEGLLKQHELNFATCLGKKDSEIEDLYAPVLYAGLLKNRYGVVIDTPKFRSAKKWSIRMGEVFQLQGKQWDERTQVDVKIGIANLVSDNPGIALEEQNRGPFDALVASLSRRLVAPDAD